MPKVAMTLEEAKITEYGFVATGDAQAGPVARLSATVVPLSPSRPSCCEMLKEKKSCSNPEILNTSFVQKTKLKFYQKSTAIMMLSE